MDFKRPPRRTLLATLGAAGVAGCLDGSLRGSPAPPHNGGDESSDGWQLVVDEQWDSFNNDRWAVGFIDRAEWIPDDDATVSADHVRIENGKCILEVESEGTGPDGCFQGVINSSTAGKSNHPDVGIPIDPIPGHYVEARLNLPGRVGVLPAFWMHPANRNWPPEIDIVELFQRGDKDKRQQLNIDVHWSTSGEVNDRSNHKHAPVVRDVGTNLTDSFNTYGLAWFENRVEWYFNNHRIYTRSGPPAMRESLTAAAARPFGLIFSNHVNRVGESDLTTSWTEQLAIDWVRVWQHAETS